MQHSIASAELLDQVGPQIEGMVHAIESCVHCGFCLAVCPTYLVLGEEMDSPRGRITLMKSALEAELSVAEAMPYIDRCLGCLACVTACPSGVEYEELVVPFRAYAQGFLQRSGMERLQRSLLQETLPHAGRFRLAAELGRLGRPLGNILPQEIRSMLSVLPGRLPSSRPLPGFYPAEGELRARVALLTGCVQSVLDPELNWATLRVLARNGVEVYVPQGQSCCGAILMHMGDQDGARRLALENLRLFPRNIDAVLTNAAGCGSGMKAYGMLFYGLPEQADAEQFAGLVQDVNEFLAELGVLAPPPLPEPLSVAFHDACHLAHAQGVRSAPRELLRSIPNLTVLEINEGDTCCGSAGTYNVAQPEIANMLGERKVANIIQSGAQAVATGNIGCMVQIHNHLKTAGQSLPVYHPFELLDLAYTQVH